MGSAASLSRSGTSQSATRPAAGEVGARPPAPVDAGGAPAPSGRTAAAGGRRPASGGPGWAGPAPRPGRTARLPASGPGRPGAGPASGSGQSRPAARNHGVQGSMGVRSSGAAAGRPAWRGAQTPAAVPARPPAAPRSCQQHRAAGQCAARRCALPRRAVAGAGPGRDRQHQFELDMRVRAAEVSSAGTSTRRAKVGGAHAQAPGRRCAARWCCGMAASSASAAAHLRPGTPAGGGGRQRLAVAHEQRLPSRSSSRGHALAHRAGGDVQFAGGALEAAQARRGLEGAQAVDGGKSQVSRCRAHRVAL
jgi:hypothetical protein